MGESGFIEGTLHLLRRGGGPAVGKTTTSRLAEKPALP